MNITTANYFSSIQAVDWNGIPAVLKKTHDTLMPDASKNDWKEYHADPDIRRTIDKYFGYIAKYVPESKAVPSATAAPAPAAKPKPAAKPSRPAKQKAKSVQNKPAAPPPLELPEPKQVTVIPTAAAFIKRYAALHGNVKTRDQILSLTHGFQKAITEQRIKKDNPCLQEVERMQRELLTLLSTMTGSVRVEIDAAFLAHCKQIAQGEEVRTSVKLIKSFISMSGKAYDKTKAGALLKKMETAVGKIPAEDPYRNQLIKAMETLTGYCKGSDKTIGVPPAFLHGLGSVAVGAGLDGLGIVVTGGGGGAIIRLLRAAAIKDLSDRTLKKALRHTAAPGLCYEIAKGMIRRHELTMEVLTAPPSKKKNYWETGIGLAGIENSNPVSESRRITDLDILEMRLLNNGGMGTSGLGNTGASAMPSSVPSHKAIPSKPRDKGNKDGQIMSAAALKTMKFESIGLTGKWKELIGDPAPGFSAMIYGLPKQGKSTFCLQLANDLAKHGEVLYCALEEGFGATLSEKLHRLGIGANTLQFSNTIPSDLRAYKFVFIDSVSEAGMDAEGLKELRRNNPGTAFIFVYHSTKAGNFRGSNRDAHDVDIIVEIKNGMASARGRYAPPSEMPV